MEPQAATTIRTEGPGPLDGDAKAAEEQALASSVPAPDEDALASTPESAEAAPAAAEGDEHLPAISEPDVRRAGRTGFWRRIAMRRSNRKAQKLAEAAPGDAVLERLERLETQVASVEDSLAAHFERFEIRFAQLWELEESLGNLGEVHRKLDELLAQNEEQAKRAKAGVRRAWAFGLAAGIAIALVAVAVLSAQ